jgi:prepilin-type processing-associated H-X9-DG protein
VPGKIGYAKFINILFGDGHVARDPSPTSVSVGPPVGGTNPATASSVSIVPDSGPYFYWGQ